MLLNVKWYDVPLTRAMPGLAKITVVEAPRMRTQKSIIYEGVIMLFQ